MTKKSKLKRPVIYTVDEQDPKLLHLRNGTRIRQAVEGVRVYCTKGGKFYSLTCYGLRTLKVDKTPKRNYCKPIMHGTGHHQGRNYPRIRIDGRDYPAHHMMMLAWHGPWDKSTCVVYHMDGNIYNWRLSNLRVVTKDECIRLCCSRRRSQNKQKRK